MTRRSNRTPVLGLIPAKGVSTRLPGKNIRPFAGSSLLQIKIRQLQRVTEDVVVSTDSEEVAAVARAAGSRVLMRDDGARSALNTDELVCAILDQLSWPESVLLYAVCTSPVFDRFAEMISVFLSQESIDASLFTARRYRRHLWANGPVNWNPPCPPTQDLPDWWEITHGAFALSTGTVAKYRCLLNESSHPFELNASEALEIDYPDEFLLGERLYETTYASSNA